jgi:hypothetical protein
VPPSSGRFFDRSAWQRAGDGGAELHDRLLLIEAVVADLRHRPAA